MTSLAHLFNGFKRVMWKRLVFNWVLKLGYLFGYLKSKKVWLKPILVDFIYLKDLLFIICLLLTSSKQIIHDGKRWVLLKPHVLISKLTLINRFPYFSDTKIGTSIGYPTFLHDPLYTRCRLSCVYRSYDDFL